MYPSPALLTISILSFPATSSYPFGAPACVSSPRHGHAPQTSGLELEIYKELTHDGDIRLQLGQPDSTFSFRGFLVTTKAPGKSLSVIVWVKIVLARRVYCLQPGDQTGV